MYNVAGDKYQSCSSSTTGVTVTTDGDWKIFKIDFSKFVNQNINGTTDRWVFNDDGTTDEVLGGIGFTTGNKTAADEFTIDTVTYTKRA